jgi:hypothetical protein
MNIPLEIFEENADGAWFSWVVWHNLKSDSSFGITFMRS